VKTIIYQGVECTTISEITKLLTEGIEAIYNDSRNKIMGAINSTSIIENDDYFKISREEIEENIHLFSNLIDRAPSRGLILYRLDRIDKIKNKVMFYIRRMIEGTYKKDRFHARRDRYSELVYKINASKTYVSKPLFKAILSTISRIEEGEETQKAIQEASKKYKVTQKEIKKLLKDIDIQLDKTKLQAKQKANFIFALDRGLIV